MMARLLLNFLTQLNLFVFLVMATAVQAVELKVDSLKWDNERSINGVAVKRASEGDFKIFYAEVGKIVERPIKEVFNDVTRFADRCNDEYKDKRRFTPKDFHCQVLNKNMVETVFIREFKAPLEKIVNRLPGETERFLLYRNLYNRDEFHYYDLVTVVEGKTSAGKQTIKVTYQMLNDDESKIYLASPELKKSVFAAIQGDYILEDLDGQKTLVKMTYASKTDHWMLTSMFATGTIFNSMSEGTSSTLSSLDKPLLVVPASK